MQPATASPVETFHPAAAAALRTSLIGDRVTIEQAAVALKVTTRSIRNAIDRYRIPYIRIFGVRLLEPKAIRAALCANEANREPRRPGRPRKAA